jgi:hypothetical protein
MAAHVLQRRALVFLALTLTSICVGCSGNDGDDDDRAQTGGKRDAATRGDAGGENERDAGGGSPAPGAPTFSAIYEEIIVGTGCNGGPLCHGGFVGKLSMTTPKESYDALVGVAAMGTNLADATNADCQDTDLVRVVPRDPDASLLVQKLDPPDGVVPCGGAMPPTGTLPAAQIEQVRTWIENGAKND